MIDFAKDTVFKLKQTDNADGEKMVAPLLTEGERVLSTYKEMRDMVVFTDKRVISVNVQKLTGFYLAALCEDIGVLCRDRGHVRYRQRARHVVQRTGSRAL